MNGILSSRSLSHGLCPCTPRQSVYEIRTKRWGGRTSAHTAVSTGVTRAHPGAVNGAHAAAQRGPVQWAPGSRVRDGESKAGDGGERGSPVVVKKQLAPNRNQLALLACLLLRPCTYRPCAAARRRAHRKPDQHLVPSAAEPTACHLQCIWHVVVRDAAIKQPSLLAATAADEPSGTPAVATTLQGTLPWPAQALRHKRCPSKLEPRFTRRRPYRLGSRALNSPACVAPPAP